VILLTGASGYIGSALLAELSKQGEKIRAVDLQPPASFRGEFLQKNILEFNEKDLKGVTTVVHLAAIADDKSALADPYRCFQVNWLGTKHLVKLSLKTGVSKFILASSASIYARTLKKDTRPLRETDEVFPQLPYAVSKLLAEKEVLSQTEMRALVFRQATVYGLGESMRYDNVVCHTMLVDALLRGIIKVSNGSQWRPLIYIDDLIQAYLAGIFGSFRGLFNISEENYQVSEIAQQLSERLGGIQVQITELENPTSYRVDSTLFSKKAFISPNVSLKEGLDRLVTKVRQRCNETITDPDQI